MSDYKAPVTRESIRKTAKMLLMHWLDKYLDDSGDEYTDWDKADEIAANAYDNEIEDEKSHAEAMNTARKRFYNELEELLDRKIQNVFNTISWDDPSHSSHGTLREEINFFARYGGE